MLRTIWGDNERYLRTYWERFQNRFYVAGDSAHRDADGYYWIMGRIDDVLNVAGHRLGTMEIESALVAHPKVAEAAVVGKHHDIKGESVFAYVVLNIPKPEGADAKSLMDELRAWVAEQLSPIAKPDDIRLTDNLPKTRSGKIMRRLLRSIARNEEITQDLSTLENPAILAQLRGDSAAPVPRSDSVKKPGAKKRLGALKAAAPKKAVRPRKTAAVNKRVAAKQAAKVNKTPSRKRVSRKKPQKAVQREAKSRQQKAAQRRGARRKK
jgi:hypothetical protein